MRAQAAGTKFRIEPAHGGQTPPASTAATGMRAASPLYTACAACACRPPAAAAAARRALSSGAGMGSRNPRVILAERATANPLASHFAYEPEHAEIPAVPEGSCLVKNAFVSVDPAMKGWISTATNYASVPTGDTMAAFGVGEVVESRLDGVEAGDIVTGRTGWQQYGLADPAQPMFRRVAGVPSGHGLSTVLGVLGINGLTAYFGLRKLGRPEAGQTVLCSTAAGAVGSAVGQLAAAAGCRVVGLAGGAEKVALCTEEFGYSAAVDYKAVAGQQTKSSGGVSGEGALAAALAEACPDGIDVYYDMVGGEVLDTVLPMLNVGGRVVVVGTAATAAWLPPPLGPRLERTVLVKRCAISGFLVFDHAAEFPEALEVLDGMVGDGTLTYREEVRNGLAACPQALADLYTGANTGKMVVKV